MTRVGHEQLPAGGQPKRNFDGPLGESRRDVAGRQDGFGDFGDDLADIGGHHGEGGLKDRSEAFRQRLRQHELEEGKLTDAATLAAAGLISTPAMPRPVEVAQASSAPATTEVRERVLGLAERCEKALTAELHMQAGRPVGIELAMGDLIPGLDKISVSLTSDRLEICLFRTGQEAGADLMASAQALADRLQVRFQRRLVRVVEQVTSVELPPSSGQAALSQLFAPRETGT